MRKPLVLSAFASFLTVASFAQSLCLNQPYGCGTQGYFGYVDGCSNSATLSFTYTSRDRVQKYLRCDDNSWGHYAWHISCRLFDVTDPNNFVLVDAVDYDPFYINGTTCTEADETDVISNLPFLAGNSNLERLGTNFDKHLVAHFNNISVQAGHTYGINMRITNYSDMWFGQIDNSVQTDENSQQMQIVATPTYSTSAWNHQTLEPTYTGVAMGNGNIAIDRNWRHIYFVGANHHLYNAVYSNSSNSAANIYDLDPHFNIAAPGALDANPNSHYVRFIGTDGKVYNAVWANNQWNMWALDNTFTNAAPGAIGFDEAWNHVYFIGFNQHLYNAVWDPAANTWHTYDLNANFNIAAPGAISVNSNSHYVRFIGTDGKVYNAVWANNQWNMWALDNTFTNAAPGAIAYDEAWNHVYFIGFNHHLYNAVWDPAANIWHTYDLNSNFAGAAYGALSVDPSGHKLLFVGTDGRPYNAVWANNQWNMWAISNNTNVTAGSLGFVEDLLDGSGTYDKDIYVCRNEQGQLDTYFWVDCLNGKNKAGASEPGAGGKSTGLGNPGMLAAAAPAVRHNPLTAAADELSVAPNPLVTTALVSYTLSEQGDVLIGVYSLSGTLVKKVAAGNQQAGTYKVPLDKGELAAGVYYISLKTAGSAKIIKLVIR